MRFYRGFMAVAAALMWTGSSLVAQQGATITGRVTSEAGQPLQSASVFIPTLNIGTLTRADGTYNLIIPAGRFQPGQTIQVSAQILGHRSLSQPIALQPGQTANLNFQLSTDVLQLEGVVATGVGTATTRERLGVSIASVSGEEINRVPQTNVVNALSGRAPGVEIRSQSGEPGAGSAIRIRGVNTIIGTGQPLFVVDGIPIDNATNNMPSSNRTGLDVGLSGTVSPNRAADINPNDIASIEILKGAAASAIYGARAANGVVLITTRQGQPGQTRASLTTSISHERVNQRIPLQTRWAQGASMVTNATSLRSWGAEIPGGQGIDHWNTLFEDGRLIDTNLTVSGGTERTTYYLTVGQMDHGGVIVGGQDHYARTSARLKGSHRLLENLNVTGNFAYAETDGSFVQKGSNVSGLLLGGLRTPPSFNNMPYLTEQGFHRSYTNQNPQALRVAGFFDNPFWSIFENRTTSEMSRMYGNLSLDYEPTQWLNLTYNLGNDFSTDRRQDLLPPGNVTTVQGYLGRADFRNQQLDHNLIGTATHAFTESLGGALTLGYNRNVRNFHRFFVEGFNIVAPGINTLDNTVNRVPDEFIWNIHTESFFGQMQADIANQLFITAALRNDGFSTFGLSQRRHWYPKLSAAWDVTQSLGIEPNPFLGFAKLRTAWGQAGNEPPVYGTIGGFTTIQLADAGWGSAFNAVYGGIGGLRSSATAEQPDLGPERTTEIELGADFSLARDRIGLGITWYDATTRDAIFLFPLAPSAGFTQQLRNAADIRNRGLEISLDTRPFTTPRFGWELGLNWSRNRNEVLSLGDPDLQFVNMIGGFSGAVGSAFVGHPVGVHRGYDFARCGRGLEMVGAANVGAACAGAPEGALYVNEFGFPILDPTERVIGNPHPDWLAGIRNNFTIMGMVQLSTLFDVKHGGQNWNGTRGALYSYGTHADTDVRAVCTAPVANRPTGCTGNEMVFGQQIAPGPVVGPGAGASVPIGENWYNLGFGSGFSTPQTLFFEDAGFVKLREIALNFTVPSNFVDRFGMSAIDVRVAGRNLATWTNYTGIDPETHVAGSNTNLQGTDYFNNPQTRQLILTIGLHR
jgi:TonB-linked SusC/RagA family outer membrane protein